MSVILKTVDDDLFASDAVAIVNPVNCVGVMGAGLAEKFMNRFPDNYEAYVHACKRALLRPGKILPFPLEDKPGARHAWVVNLATKDHWRNESKKEWIIESAQRLHSWAEEQKIEKIACPALGAGLGKLDWESVKQILVEEFQHSAITLELYPPKPRGYRSDNDAESIRPESGNSKHPVDAAEKAPTAPAVRKGFKNLYKKRT